VLSENLTGLARIVRAAVVPALENVTLWHERDISHSSVERVIAPDATIALDFALVRLAGMMERWWCTRRGCWPTWRAWRCGALRRGAAGTDPDRHPARGRVSDRPAQTRWRPGEPGRRRGAASRANLLADDEVAGRVSEAELDQAMDPALHLKEVDHVFARVFGATRRR